MNKYFQLQKKIDQYLLILERKRASRLREAVSLEEVAYVPTLIVPSRAEPKGPASFRSACLRTCGKLRGLNDDQRRAKAKAKTFILSAAESPMRHVLLQLGWQEMPFHQRMQACLILSQSDRVQSFFFKQQQRYNHLRGSSCLTNELQLMLLLSKKLDQPALRNFPFPRFSVIRSSDDMQVFGREAKVTQIMAVLRFHCQLYGQWSSAGLEPDLPLLLNEVLLGKQFIAEPHESPPPTNVPLLFYTLLFAMHSLGAYKDSEGRVTSQFMQRQLLSFHRYLIQDYGLDIQKVDLRDSSPLEFDEGHFRFRYKAKLQRPSLQVIALLQGVDRALSALSPSFRLGGARGVWRKVGTCKQLNQAQLEREVTGFKLDPDLTKTHGRKTCIVRKVVLLRKVKPLRAYSLKRLKVQGEGEKWDWHWAQQQTQRISLRLLQIAEQSLQKSRQCFELIAFRFWADRSSGVWLLGGEEGTCLLGQAGKGAVEEWLRLVEDRCGRMEHWRQLDEESLGGPGGEAETVGRAGRRVPAGDL